MTTNWTDLDPGAGDLTACDSAKLWTDAQLGDLDNAEATVSGILRELDDSWTGDSADSFRARLTQFHSRIEDSIEAMQTAGKAIVVYGDSVSEIARQAEPLKDDLAAAKATLGDVINGPKTGNNAQDRLDTE